MSSALADSSIRHASDRETAYKVERPRARFVCDVEVACLSMVLTTSKF
eukprot:CAMPEP_0169465492 /NCGR_PEP_ID=MMETSP1042-20121227/21244_1 /TAXON_ID=464988 /ORGANISM="Hemiselmis andersenii, Strain CCMP1180" /LENGTH=47 /DNA_ID= /DNA_START= /DNA_END= /DNA_ORIENTATION=